MNLERAIQIAVEAHTGQRDKAGQPYVLHCLRVMFALRSYEERIVGVLHVVVEDCDGWSFDRLKSAGFTSTVLDALDSVTKRAGEDYMAFVRRAGENPIFPVVPDVVNRYPGFSGRERAGQSRAWTLPAGRSW